MSPRSGTGANTAERVPTHDARMAAEGVAPRAQPLLIGERRMQHRHRGCEALAEAADELRGEPDLRHQHQRAAPGREHRCHELQIHLGLAAAGDPVQHECGEVTERRADRGHRLGLLAGKLGPRQRSALASEGGCTGRD